MAGRIVPVYRLTAGLTAARLRVAEREALDRAGYAYPEYLPAGLRERGRAAAHRRRARGRPLPAGLRRPRRSASTPGLRRAARAPARHGRPASGAWPRHRPRAVAVDDAGDAAIREALRGALERRVGREVALTGDQAVAMDQIRTDLAGPTPMLRLLQGDVGSGKTAVAAYALAAVARGPGSRARSWPRPTCSRGSTSTRSAPCSPTSASTSSCSPARSRPRSGRAPSRRSRPGQASVVVGTHALFQEAVVVRPTRPGRRRRAAPLRRRAARPARGEGRRPRAARPAHDRDADPADARARSSTPTSTSPTCARRRPAGSRSAPGSGAPTTSTARGSGCARRRPRASDVRRRAADRGGERRRSTTRSGSSAVAAETEAERLTERLAPLRVGLVHGRLKPVDRDAEMRRFRDGDLDVLVGTTVVEVGVDVPEATMMIIEGADRFGLAQLHQLRGRVGRGDRRSRSACSSRTRPTRRRGPGSRPSPSSATASSSPNGTSSCGARATSSASSRAACRDCGSPRSRARTTSGWPSSPAEHAGGAARCRPATLDIGRPAGPRAARRGARPRLAAPARGRGPGERRDP